MPLAEKGVRGKGRQPLSPPQHIETRSAISASVSRAFRGPRVKPSTTGSGQPGRSGIISRKELL